MANTFRKISKMVQETKKKVEALSSFELGYLAGLIDGEGCISLGYDRLDFPSPLARLNIANTDPRMILWLKIHLGGHVSQSKNDLRTGGKWKRCYSWTLSGEQVCEILSACLPLLVIKKEQAEIYLNFYILHPRSSYRVSQERRKALILSSVLLKEERAKIQDSSQLREVAPHLN